MSAPPNFLIFELYQHDVPQKSTFFIENSDSEQKVNIFNGKLEKNQIFLLAPFRIVVLCTKTLTEASMMLELKKKIFFAFL